MIFSNDRKKSNNISIVDNNNERNDFHNYHFQEDYTVLFFLSSFIQLIFHDY
jgi:hypothetical protein